MRPSFLPLLIIAQVSAASLTGVVRDAGTGAPIAGAVVTLPDLDRWTTSGTDGRYLLRAIPAGPVHVTVRRIGYRPAALHAIVPGAGRLEVGVSLLRGPRQLTAVDIRAAATTGLAGSGGRREAADRALTAVEIANHPLLAEADALGSLGGGAVALRPEAPGGLHVRGGATDQTAYLLDGIPILNPYHSAGMFGAWNPDALARVQLTASAPAPWLPATLSGAVQGETRTPAPSLAMRGGVSTSHARLTLDGPIGRSGSSGFLISARAGFPDVIAPRKEATYVRGATRDAIAVISHRVLGGELKLLGYWSLNDLDAQSALSTDTSTVPPEPRNRFAWSSRSVGAAWHRSSGPTSVRVTAWSAGTEAASDWAALAGPLRLNADRRDMGTLLEVERRRPGVTDLLGARVERSRTRYAIIRLDLADTSGPTAVRTTGTLFGQRTLELPGALTLDAAAALAFADDGLRLGPLLQLRWHTTPRVTWSVAYSRSHQFAQSLRNGESVVGAIFPVDLYAGGKGVPVARSDQGVAAVAVRPRPGLRFGAEAYARRLSDILLVAPVEGEPFSTGSFASGRGTAYGAAAEVALSAARYNVLATYGVQSVRFTGAGSQWTPEHGSAQTLDAGITVFATTSTSLRVGAASAFGRRTTAIANGFEWEACNLLDQGCEFGGSPRYQGEVLGGTALPAFFRVDVGVRHHFHVLVGGRDAQVGLYGSFSNALGRRNVLTFARDPASGTRVPVEMRPPAALVVGLDWRF